MSVRRDWRNFTLAAILGLTLTGCGIWINRRIGDSDWVILVLLPIAFVIIMLLMYAFDSLECVMRDSKGKRIND